MSRSKETKSFEAVVSDLDMSEEEKEAFQDYLDKNYSDLRHSNDYDQLVEIAHECLGR